MTLRVAVHAASYARRSIVRFVLAVENVLFGACGQMRQSSIPSK